MNGYPYPTGYLFLGQSMWTTIANVNHWEITNDGNDLLVIWKKALSKSDYLLGLYITHECCLSNMSGIEEEIWRNMTLAII